MIIVRNIENMIPQSAIPSLSNDTVNSILGNVAASARNHWLRLAGEDRSSFRGDYIHGIQPAIAESSTRHVVALVGEVPHMLEEGSPRLDMRDTLLGPNVPAAPMGKRGKHPNKDGGFFRAIPIRHSTPGSGKNAGLSIGSAYSGHSAVMDSSKMGKAVYKAAMALEKSTTTPFKKTGEWGGRLDVSKLTAGLNKGTKGVPLLKPHHKSNIYQGMVRQEKTYEKATQNTYTTFRTISTSVQDGSWWRKPIEARHYAKKTGDFVAKILPDAIEAYLRGGR